MAFLDRETVSAFAEQPDWVSENFSTSLPGACPQESSRGNRSSRRPMTPPGGVETGGPLLLPRQRTTGIGDRLEQKCPFLVLARSAMLNRLKFMRYFCMVLIKVTRDTCIAK
jgi:hypothetical protein